MDNLFTIVTYVVVGLAAVILAIGLARRIGLFQPHPRIVLRRCLFLQDDLGYVDEACLLLLKMEFDVGTSEEASKQVSEPRRLQGQPSIPSFGDKSQTANIDVSLAGTRIPLSFLWGWAQRVVLGPPDTFDFIVSRSEDGDLLIEAWRTNDGEYFSGWSSLQKGADLIRTGIRRIAEEIRAAYPRYRPSLLDQYIGEERYSDAQSLVDRIEKDTGGKQRAKSTIDPKKLDEFRAWVCFGSGDYKRALALFETAVAQDTVHARIDCLANLARYDEALDLVDSLPATFADHERILKRGTIQRAKRDLKAATSSLEQCIRSANHTLNTCRKETEKHDAYWSLIVANQFAAEYMLAVDQPMERERFLEGQLVASRDLRKLDPSSQPISYEAWALQDLDRHEEAILAYRECLDLCVSDRQDRPDDVEYVINCAWAHAGLVETLRRDINSRLELCGFTVEVLEDVLGILWTLGEELASKSKSERAQTIGNIASGELDLGELPDFEDVDLSGFAALRNDSRELKELLDNCAEQFLQTTEAIDLFTSLTGRKSVTHVSEGHYGLAGVWATYGKWDDVQDELVLATKINLAMIERACWDSDLAELRRQIYGCHTVPYWDCKRGWFVQASDTPD